MAGVLDDARKTAFGAVALLVLALFFADRGGAGESAVAEAEALAREHRHEPAPGPAYAAPLPVATIDAKSWFAAGSDEDEPMIDPPVAAAGGAAAAAPSAPGQVHWAEPSGPDFPPGLRR